MRFLISIILLTSGCIPEIELPCDSADFVTGGICVITNGYNVDPSMVEFAVTTVSKGVNDKLDRDDNLPLIFDDLRVAAEYVDPEDPILSKDGEQAYRGLTYNTNVIVNYIGEEGALECLEHYYVLGHELLHVVSKYILGVSAKDNADHEVAKIFLSWAYERGLNLSMTAEFDVYMDVLHECEDRYGEIEW